MFPLWSIFATLVIKKLYYVEFSRYIVIITTAVGIQQTLAMNKQCLLVLPHTKTAFGHNE